MKKVELEEFKRRIEKRFPEEEFEILEYNSLKKPAKIQCKQCGKIIDITYASNFLAKNKRYGCVECYGLWKEREKRIARIKERYEIIEKYIKDTHTYYIIKCKKCGHIRNTRESNIIKSLDCGCVTGVFKKRTPEEFIALVNQNTEDEYELVSEYKGQSSKILLRHKKCGFIRQVWAHDAINGRFLCPHCDKKQSRAVRYITNYLKKRNVEFEIEVPLLNSRQRFDFYFPNQKIALEYDGIQHYEENDYFKVDLATIQERDKRKDKYCKDNNIKMYRIPYFYSNQQIEKVLKEIISSTTILQKE